jgi:hypothetical protein
MLRLRLERLTNERLHRQHPHAAGDPDPRYFHRDIWADQLCHLGLHAGVLGRFLNGVHLVNGTDYTASNGSDVVLTTGATTGDNLEVVAYTTFQVVDQSFSGNFSVDSPTFVVDAANNRVGIGTSSPSENLDVRGAGTTTIAVRTTDTSGANVGQVRIDYTGGGGGTPSQVDLRAGDAYAYLVSPTNIPMLFGTNNAERMRITNIGDVGIGTSSPVAKNHIRGSGTSGQVSASWILENFSSGTAGMDITGAAGASRWRYLYGGGPGTGTNTLTEAMCILTEGASAGNVGIGTSSPVLPLDVVANSGANALSLRTRGSDDYSFLTFRSNNGGEDLGGLAIYRTAANTSNLLFYTGGGGAAAERARIDASGNLLVGTTSSGVSKVYAAASGNFHALRGEATTAGYVGVYGGHSVNGGTGYTAYFFNSGSSTGLYMSNTAAWQSISDARMKEDVRDLDTTERLMQLRPVDYLWKHQATSDDPDRRNLGFIAQEVQQVFPELVSTSPDGKLGVEYTGLIAPLVKAIQEQQAIIEALEARISALEGEPA